MERADQIALARDALPELKKIAAEVTEFVAGLRLESIPWEDVENDPKARADYMTRAMMLIQFEHLRSELTLVEHGHDRDASIIARSIVECLAQLLWALMDEPARTDRWFWYAVVLERLQLIKNKERETEVDPTTWSTSEKLIDTYGPIHYNDRTVKALKQGRELPPERDRFRYRWHEEDISDLIRWTLGEGTALDYWRSASAWAHSSPLAAVRALDQGDGPIRYEQADPREAAQALYISIHCCLNTFQLASSRFGPRYLEQIDMFFARLPRKEGGKAASE